MSEAVVIDHVSKYFKLSKDKPKSAKERVIRAGRIKWEEFRALQDVSFSVEQGETLAMLGHNGSGKSTLLKCVAGTLRPTKGSITTRGRLAALLELGAGFHPDLTGRENVFLNGSILGFSKSQVEGIFDDIVDFAELEEFIDLQVKHYSSGMYARLGFAVAINVEPDILLVDEVLSVGDEAFQRKCIDRIRRMQRDGRTILVVSHASELVRQICDRAVVLHHGVKIADAEPGEAIHAFREALAGDGEHGVPILAEEGDHTPATIADPVTGEMPIIVGPAALVPDPGATVKIAHVIAEYPDPDADHLQPGQPLKLRIGYAATGMITDVAFGLEVFDEDGVRLVGTSTDVLEQYIHAVKGEGEVTFVIDEMPLLEGRFPMTVTIHSHDGGTIYDEREFEDHFSVLNPTRANGIVSFPIKVEHLFHF